MSILVTGSSGYIGSRLAQQLRAQGREVYGVDRDPCAAPALSGAVTGDLLAPSTLERTAFDVDCICHLAAAKDDWGLSEAQYYRDNVEATRAVIEAGKEAGVKDWLFYSTVSVMGPSHEAIDETAGFAPVNSYGASKAEAETLFYQLAAEDPAARVVIVRPSVVYGPGNPACTNVYRLVDAIYKNQFVMVGPGKAIKSTSYIHNLLAATLFLMNHRLTHHMERGVETYIYVDEPALTTGALVEEIYALLGKRRPPWRVPLKVASSLAAVFDVAASLTGINFPVTAARIRKFNRSTNFDGRALRKLGFAQPVSNEAALRATVKWHLEHEYGKPLPGAIC